MPAGVRLTASNDMGPRVIVKKARSYHNTRNTSAAWPESQLNEVSHYKMACIVDGHVNFQLNNSLLQCGPGYFIFIPPGMPHPMSAFPFIDTALNSSCDILYFVLYDDALQCWINRCREGQKIETESNSLFTDEHTTTLLRILMKEAFNGEKNSPEICGRLLPVMLQLLQREIEGGRFQTLRGDNANDYSAPETRGQNLDFKTRLERYVQSNFHKPLTLNRAAHEMYLSRSQFALLVRRETGKSFNQLLVEQRIEAAKTLLRDSPWTVATIAEFVGFKSPSYFRTFFHKYTGQTPTEFREYSRQN